MPEQEQKQQEFNENRARRSVISNLEEMGFSWLDEEVRVKPPERERAYILSAVVYRRGDDGEKEPFVVVDVKQNPGTWARDQMLPYARHLDAPYIFITNGQKEDWYRTENPEETLESSPSPPGPESGARAIRGPEELSDVYSFFRRTLEWEPDEQDALVLASLLLKFAHERSRVDVEPSSEESMYTAFSSSGLPEFLRRHRHRLLKNWDRSWRYLSSYSIPDDFLWSRYPGWLAAEQGRFRLDERRRNLLASDALEFFRDVCCAGDRNRVATIEYNLGTVGISIAEREHGPVTVFDPDQEFVDIIRALSWAERLKERSDFEVAGTDPVQASIVDQFREQFDLFVLVMPPRGEIEVNSEEFELADHRHAEPAYLEAGLRMLEPGGRMIAAVPGVLLSGKRNRNVRDYLREHAVIEASVALPLTPGDPRNRRNSTCLICRKRTSDAEPQKDVFMGVIDDSDDRREEVRALTDELCSFLTE